MTFTETSLLLMFVMAACYVLGAWIGWQSGREYERQLRAGALEGKKRS